MAVMVSPFLTQCVSPCGGGGGFHPLSLGFVCLSGPGLRLFRSPGLQWGLWFCPPPHAVLCESLRTWMHFFSLWGVWPFRLLSVHVSVFMPHM